MKLVTQWLETTIANVQYGKSSKALYVAVLLVLTMAAISLYILLNSPE